MARRNPGPSRCSMATSGDQARQTHANETRQRTGGSRAVRQAAGFGTMTGL